MKIRIGLALWLAIATPALADCATLDRAFSGEAMLRQRSGDWPAQWGLFLAEEVGSPRRDAVWQGCGPGDGTSETVTCAWRFDLRDPESAATLGAIEAALARCLGPDAGPEKDRAVNHPDTYDASIFELPRHRITVALKDKSALGATLVTLRVYDAD